MEYRFNEILRDLDYNELIAFKKELDYGSVNLTKMLKEKIKEKENLHQKSCSVCQSDIPPTSRHNYTIVFGPNDFRKKATFCAMDCLKYFISNLEQLHKEVKNEEKV